MTSCTVLLLLFLSVWHVSALHKCDVWFMVAKTPVGKLVVEGDGSCAKLDAQGKKVLRDLTKYFFSHPKNEETSQTKLHSLPFKPVMVELPLADKWELLTLKEPRVVERFVRLWRECPWQAPKTGSASESSKNDEVIFETTAKSAVKLYSIMNREFLSVSTSPERRAVGSTSSGRRLGGPMDGSKSPGGAQPHELLVLPKLITDDATAEKRSAISPQSLAGHPCDVQFVVGGKLFANLLLRFDEGDCRKFNSTESFTSQMAPFLPSDGEASLYDRLSFVPGVGVHPQAAEFYPTDTVTVTLKEDILLSLFLRHVFQNNWKFRRADANTLLLEGCADRFSRFLENFIEDSVRDDSVRDDIRSNFTTLRRRSPDHYVVLRIREREASQVSALFKVNKYRSAPQNNFWKNEPFKLVYQIFENHGKRYFRTDVKKWKELKFLQGHAYHHEEDRGVFTMNLHSEEKIKRNLEDLVGIDPAMDSTAATLVSAVVLCLFAGLTWSCKKFCVEFCPNHTESDSSNNIYQ